MTSMNRLCAKNLQKSLNSFSVVKEMVKKAVDEIKPTLVKSLGKNREKMDNCFIEMCIMTTMNRLCAKNLPAQQPSLS